MLSASQVGDQPETVLPLTTPSAPVGALSAQDTLSDGNRPTTPDFYLTKRGRKLAGWKLETFNEFWEAFAYKKGRAEAADAWLNIPNLSRNLAARISDAAKKEAKARPGLLSKGQTPKWAQGWLSARRWEDWEDGNATTHNQDGVPGKEVNHDSRFSRSSNEEESEYLHSLTEALKRFM